MSGYARENAAESEDRLPWLEPVEDESIDDGVPAGKLVALLVAAVVAFAIVVGGVWALRQHRSPTAEVKDPSVIQAPGGDYKTRPQNPGGMKVEGKGDTAFSASAGTEPDGKIDTNATPEAPMAGTKFVVKPQNPVKIASGATVALPKSAGTLVAKSPVTPAQTSAITGGHLVQLGAYGSESKAELGWDTLSKKYAFLAALPKSIVQAEVAGAAVYRLRADAGGDAAGICGKLKAAGGNCLVVN